VSDAPFSDEALRRIRMTASGRDCSPIPKIPEAGNVLDGVQFMHNGVRVQADGYCGPWMTEIIRRLRGHHEPQEEWAFHLLLRHARPGTRILELGSYWAYYSLWYLKAVPHSRATLIEPDPNYMTVGRRNFELNDARGEFLEGCIGEESNPSVLFPCEEAGARTLRQFTVDELLAKPGAEPVEVLLADIQGAELRMLQGAAASLKRGRVRFLVLSTHHHTISGDPLTHLKCLEFIRAHGGRVLAEHDIHESFSGDGLIVAAFDPLDASLPTIRVSRNTAAESLFRPLNYDLAEAWETIERLKNARIGPAHPEPAKPKRWHSLGRWIGRKAAGPDVRADSIQSLPE
jgi:FkbM family methyltransferase